MAKKTIAQIYHDAHHATGVRQHERHGNPITAAPAHVPAALACAIRDELITEAQARKLAIRLGRLSYGEWGLTIGRVGGAILKECGQIDGSMQLEAALSQF